MMTILEQLSPVLMVIGVIMICMTAPGPPKRKRRMKQPQDFPDGK